MIYLRQISKEQMDISAENEEHKWLKSILPFEYLNQAIETGIANYQQQHVNHSSIANSASMSKNYNRPLSTIINNEVKTKTEIEPIVITNLLKETHLDLFDGYQVIVVNINDKDFDCPGMLVEEKVLNECDLLGSSASAASLFLNSRKNQEKPIKKHHPHHQHHRDQRHTNKKEDMVDNLDSSYEPTINGNAIMNSVNNSLKMTIEATSSIDRDDVRSRHEGSVGKN